MKYTNVTVCYSYPLIRDGIPTNDTAFEERTTIQLKGNLKINGGFKGLHCTAYKNMCFLSTSCGGSIRHP